MKRLFEKYAPRFLRLKRAGNPYAHLLLLCEISFLTSCQTTPTKFDALEKAKWSAKLLFRNIKEVRSQIVNADIVAIRPSRLRMEITTPIGIYIASFIMNEHGVKYILPREKKYVEGPASSQSMKMAVGVELNPQLFMNVLFDSEPGEKSWVCKRDKKGYLESCENSIEKVSIVWADREAAKKRIDVKTRDFTLQIALKGFSTKVEEPDGLFELAPPVGFEIQRMGDKPAQ